MKMNRSQTIKAAIERVWSIIADHYAEVGKWARAVQSSAPNSDASPVGTSKVGGRVCETSIGPASEVLTRFDAENHQLTYKAHADKMPFFVKALYGDWKLTSLGDETRVDFGFEADISFPFSTFMPPLMKLQFKGPIQDTLEDLKTLLETSKTHPDKGGVEVSDLFSAAPLSK